MANRVKYQLLSNVAVTGGAFTVQQGGYYSFSADGTFGGATVALFILSPDGVSYIAIPNASFTAEGVLGVDLPSGANVKAVVSGGAPANLYAALDLVQ